MTQLTISRAFTTRIPLAVMIALGIKQWENRAAMPAPSRGICGMTCSKDSSAKEYSCFRAWAQQAMRPEIFAALPQWQAVEHWRGKLVAVCDYAASFTPGNQAWNEGYPVWWRLDNVRLLKNPIPVRGSVGMWNLNLQLSE